MFSAADNPMHTLSAGRAAGPPPHPVRARRVRRLLGAAVGLAAALAGTAFLAFGQGTDNEPNNTCEAAQALGNVTMPYTLTGALLPIGDSGDLDFFRLTAPAGSWVRLGLEGRLGPGGRLDGPRMGTFTSDCTQLAYGDSSSGALQINALVPDDGVLVVAVTVNYDYSFTNGGRGAYRLTFQKTAVVRGVSGGVVDAKTGQPVANGATVSLFHCADATCAVSDTLASGYTDQSGAYSFSSGGNGGPFFVGTYVVRIAADRYLTGETPAFVLAENEDRHLATLLLHPIPNIRSVQGRVVDSVTGRPLPGQVSPRAHVQLRRCDSGTSSCYYAVAEMDTDADGRFHFERDGSDQPLPAQSYVLYVKADQYEEYLSQPIALAADEDKDVLDLPVKSLPVRFAEVRPCGNLPSEGGDCRYSMRLWNGQAVPLMGAAWSVVTVGATFFGSTESVFQVGEMRPVTLSMGTGQVLNFEFSVPPATLNGTNICAVAYAGAGSDPAFGVLGKKDLFCITKGANGFRLLSATEVAALKGQAK